ncbi:MAG: polysaccharide biosynthesis C-terminal domain-containing protein [Parabacteroides sp.]|nr:polysaccharide biosynthesis C-terminal domain-containing protein [Parabacteroides sp.]
MKNRLSGRFGFRELVHFAWPTIIMMIFMSLYSKVDGVFVARLIGTDALSAVNIVYPLFGFCFAPGVMLATGSSAIVAKLLGEGKPQEARENFTFIMLASVVTGALLGLLGYIFYPDIFLWLGVTPEIYDMCEAYLVTLFYFAPVLMLQVLFQSYFVAAGKPGYGLAVVTAGGIANIILDYVFIAVLDMGIAGAALATGIGLCIPGVLGLLYFSFYRKGTLWFAKPRMNLRVLVSSIVNGSSEMVTNLSTAVITFLFNTAMLRFVGVDGVAAITIILYSEFILNSVYFGFSSGVAPLFSYKLGRQDGDELKRLFRNSIYFIGGGSLLSVSAAFLFGGYIIALFTGIGSTVYELAVYGLGLFAYAFVFMGFNIFGSALFTALSSGKMSALLSFLRFLFIAGFVIVLPRYAGVAGIWLAVPMAEVITLLLTIICVNKYRAVYQYA